MQVATRSDELSKGSTRGGAICSLLGSDDKNVTTAYVSARTRKMGRGDDKHARKKTRANSMGLQWWRKLTLPRRGKKGTLLAPAPATEAQCARLERRSEKLHKAIAAPRTARVKHMAVAEWDAGRGMARVTVPKGNAMQSMGVFEEGVQWLWPEEAMLQVDKGTLDLKVSGVPVSLQRAWAMMLEAPNAATTEEYLAFVHLRRAGYVVRRVNEHVHQGPGVLRVTFSAWRVGAFRRKDDARPLFHLAVFRYEDPPPTIAAISALLETTGKTRLRVALIDRGVVVLTDMASNATPLSDRFLRRLTPAQAAAARKQLTLPSDDSNGNHGSNEVPMNLEQDSSVHIEDIE